MTVEADRVARVLAERYRVERDIGSGATATVFLARDLRHDRDVALKVLRPELAAAVGSERFLREIRITARLNHPHILPLLDSGEADGLLYFAAPFMPEGSLRRLLASAPLTVDVATRICEHVASALDHAHGHDVLHRDVKPENVLFSAGHAVVGDFGLARALDLAGSERLTGTGMGVGTPGYMSPEQAMGKGDLDGRTDVFSLGCVTYEMLVGETPAAWPTHEDVTLGRFTDAPPAHRARLDALPGRLEQTLARGTALRPDDRFATPGTLARAIAEAATGTAKLPDRVARDLLERAAAIQLESGSDETPGSMSMGAVEQVAAEVGIPPDQVREAAREMGVLPAPARPAPPAQPAGWGEILRTYRHRGDRITLERTVEGEVGEGAFGPMVRDIQTILGEAGHASTLGGGLTWSPASPGGTGRRLVVSVTPADGATTIRLEERYDLEGWRMFAPGMGAGAGALATAAIFIGLLGIDAPVVLVILALMAITGALGTANGLLLGNARKRLPLLEATADALEARTRAAITGSGAGDDAMVD